MVATGDHIAAMLRSHATGNQESFYSVALQIAAKEAQKGHSRVAERIRNAVDASRQQQPNDKITRHPSFTDEFHQLVAASYPDTRLSQLVVSDHVREQLNKLLTEQRQRQKLLNYGFPPMDRLLFEGPPGTGKTMSASVIAHELSMPLYSVRLDGLLSKYMGETSAKLRIIFDHATTERGVYFFDEFDALGANRAGADVGEARRILNSFLIFLENTNTEAIIIAATNHGSILDNALFRRFDEVIQYSRPNFEQAISLIKGRLGSLGHQLGFKQLTDFTERLSHAEIVKAAESAAKEAILAGIDRVRIDDLISSLQARQRTKINEVPQE